MLPMFYIDGISLSRSMPLALLRNMLNYRDAKTAVKSAKENDESDPDVAIHQRVANWGKWPPPFRSHS